MNGWIKLHRKITEWEWWNDLPTRNVFLQLLLSATHKPLKYCGHELPVGSVVTGRYKLAEETGLSDKQIRRALSNLEKTGEIVRKRASKFSIITICNYDKYQVVENGAGPAEGQQRASRGPLNKKVRSKEVKNIYGTLNNVLLTEEEHQKLQDKFPDYSDRIDRLSEYIASKGKKYKSHYATILTWSRRDKKTATKEDHDATRERFATEILSEYSDSDEHDEEVVYQIQRPETKSCGINIACEGISRGLDCRASDGSGVYKC